MVGGACRRVPSSRGLGAAASPERPVARGASVMKRRALLSAAASPHPRWPHPRWPRHPQRRPTAWSLGPRPPEVPPYAVHTARDGSPEAGMRTAHVPWRASCPVPQVRTLCRRPARQYGGPGAHVSAEEAASSGGAVVSGSASAESSSCAQSAESKCFFSAGPCMRVKVGGGDASVGEGEGVAARC